MRNTHTYSTVKTAILFTFVLVLTSSLFAQSESKTNADSVAGASANPKTVNAEQSGPWTVGIDPTKNTVRLSNSTADAVPVRVLNGAAKQPFHTKISVSIFGGGPSSGTETSIEVPAGKRLVIESISAMAEVPAGERASISLLSYADATPASWGLQYLSFIDQGTFGTQTLLTANHKTAAYAVGRITLRARPTWAGASAPAFVMITGYLEDLPSAP